MRVEELDYELPERQIAQFPPERRDGARMLELVSGGIRHRKVSEFAEAVEPGSLLVLNDTRVLLARLVGERSSTLGRVELLLLEPYGANGSYFSLARAKRPLDVGESVAVGDVEIVVEARTSDGRVVVRTSQDLPSVLERHGHVPLPPYVKRDDRPSDRERYQTVFARHPGSSAAPTAGLHLTDAMLDTLRGRGVEIGFLTLHVGLGTFRPVASETLDQHPMHEEALSVSFELVAQVERARARGKPVVAVGTTVVRALESAALGGQLEPLAGRTSLLIRPGFDFRVVDALLTNFHAPRSTLLALVYAFAGADRVREAYRQAIENDYRFLSYGDAMWIPNPL